MTTCLFCSSHGPFSTVEHIVPESLGNDDLILTEEVCDKCQAYFGTEVEKYVLDKTEFAFWRVFLGIKTKGRKYPSVDMSQPRKQSGRYPNVHSAHDDIGFTAHDDGSTSVEINADSILSSLLDGSRTQFRCVMTPHLLFMLGRFLCKVGIELLCSNDPVLARAENFDQAREYARRGSLKEGLWPLFRFDEGKIKDLRKYTNTDDGVFEEVSCYQYSLNCIGEYVLFRFGMGTSNWVVCLNNPFPTPEIKTVFPEANLQLIWYAKEEWISLAVPKSVAHTS